VERGAARVRAPRREPGFAIASLAGSLPGRPGPSRAEELGRQMMEVASRPVSRASSLYDLLEEEGEEEEEEDGGEDGTTSEDPIGGDPHSARSMPCSRRKAVSRKSLADRLARVSGVRAALDTRRVRPRRLRRPRARCIWCMGAGMSSKLRRGRGTRRAANWQPSRGNGGLPGNML
jgi:hypothetical protein